MGRRRAGLGRRAVQRIANQHRLPITALMQTMEQRHVGNISEPNGNRPGDD